MDESEQNGYIGNNWKLRIWNEKINKFKKSWIENKSKLKVIFCNLIKN